MNANQNNPNSRRDQWLHLRLNPEEKQQIESGFKQTTQRKLSDYARKILLGQPMIGSYRNRSLDALMEELMVLRKDLNGLCNNFNQTVHKLHTLDHSDQVLSCLARYEVHRIALFAKVNEMKSLMDRLGEKWLQ